MAKNSSIEWTESTWNPTTGCTKISDGCKNCYAEKMARRLQAMNNPRYKNGFQVSIHEDLIDLPLSWKKPQMIFVNSMSDLFHENIPDSIILKIFQTMNKADWHIFQVLTKRSDRLRSLSNKLPWSDNIWMGVTVEDAKVQYRIKDLIHTSAYIKFLSLEPLIGPLKNLELTGINWIIVGGESGPGARPMNPEWVKEIRDNCLKTDTPFFFKQWGGFNKKKNGRKLDGQYWNQQPSYTIL
ncbi:phage Gp37/Gp68 family protein [bacterium]|nr:phage Gp37/Gp68 family protein [bacterium]